MRPTPPQALRPLAGQYASILFAMGLFNASLFAASILPLSTAYTVCEGLGFESGVGKKFSEAPVFYWLYTILIVAGAGVILIPDLPLVKISVFSQVVNGVVVPLDPGLDAASGQQEGPDGGFRQFSRLSTSSPGRRRWSWSASPSPGSGRCTADQREDRRSRRLDSRSAWA